MRTEFLCISVLRVVSGPWVKLTGCKKCFNPLTSPSPSPTSVVYSTDCCKAVVLVLFLLFVTLCSFVAPALLSGFFSFLYVL